jgi:hypothetical protein
LSTLSGYTLNSRGERLHPCLKPLLTRTGFDNKPPCYTTMLSSLYSSFIASISSLSTLKLLNSSHNLHLGTKSYAFSKPTSARCFLIHSSPFLHDL